MDEAVHDELVRYLDGALSKADQQAFEQRLQTDESLQAELALLTLARTAVQQAGTAQQVRRIHAEHLARKQSAAPVRQLHRMRKMGMAIAASLLVVAGALAAWVASVQPGAVYADHLLAYQVSAQRSGNALSALQKAYGQKQYAVVAAQAGAQNLKGEDSLLVAVSYLQLKQPAVAQQWLQQMITGRGAYAEDAAYYLAFAFLQNGRYAEALQRLQAIADNPGHLYHQLVTPGLLWKVRALKWKN